MPERRPSKLAVAWTAGRLAGRRMLGLRAGERDLELGARLTGQLDELKGLAMKVGQIVSYLDVPLPEPVQEQLARLQTGQRGMAPAQVRQVVEAALGRPLEDAFESFEWEPVAAASIGQVHRAVVSAGRPVGSSPTTPPPAGRRVAVKVQYPEVARSFDDDLRAAGRLSSLASLASAVDGRALIEELRARLVEECDYQREARAQAAFARAFAHDRDVLVPAVLPERSATTVLTTDWIDGEPFAALRTAGEVEAERLARAQPAAALRTAGEVEAEPERLARAHPAAAQARRDAVAATLVRFAHRSLWQLAAIQADPHPGNFLFPPVAGHGSALGRVAFLDFGCVRALDPAMVEALRAVAVAVRDGDRPRFREAARALGVVGRPSSFDYDAFFAVMEHLHRPLLSASFTIDPDYVREGYALNGPGSPNARTMAMPPAYIWVARLQWGLWSILARLRARVALRDTTEELLASPIEPLRLDAPVGPGSTVAAPGEARA